MPEGLKTDGLRFLAIRVWLGRWLLIFSFVTEERIEGTYYTATLGVEKTRIICVTAALERGRTYSFSIRE